MQGEQIAVAPWKRIAKHFISNKLSLLGLVVVVLFVFISIFGYLIMPDSSPNANQMHLQLRAKPPGYAMQFLVLPKSTQTERTNVLDFLFNGKAYDFDLEPISSYYVRNDSLIITPYISDEELAEQQAYALSSFGGGNLTQNTIEQQYIHKRIYWLGTDLYGRDMLSRMILGSRISLFIGFMSVLIAMVIGITVGSLAGYYGGWIDIFSSWFINVLWALPSLLIIIAMSFALGRSFMLVFVAIGITTWVDIARMVRGHIISLREVEFVEAARAMGFNDFRIIVRYLLPNITGEVMVLASANFASAILLEAGLSFLGYGAQPPSPSWGGMIKEHYAYIIMDAAYLALLPGMAIMMIVYAFNLVSVGLSDAFNVRSQN
jgi:ABC-type dipeptide/oligopeptide/nickel transport system permease subunit